MVTIFCCGNGAPITNSLVVVVMATIFSYSNGAPITNSLVVVVMAIQLQTLVGCPCRCAACRCDTCSCSNFPHYQLIGSCGNGAPITSTRWSARGRTGRGVTGALLVTATRPGGRDFLPARVFPITNSLVVVVMALPL